MYAIVLISILAVLLVAGILTGVYTHFVKKKRIDKSGELNSMQHIQPKKAPGEEKEAPNKAAYASGYSHTVARYKEDTIKWIKDPQNRIETRPARRLIDLTPAEKALFDATRASDYWRKFDTPAKFLAELYRMEASAMLYMTSVPYYDILSKYLGCISCLCGSVEANNAWAFNLIDLSIFATEKLMGDIFTDADVANSQARTMGIISARVDVAIAALSDEKVFDGINCKAMQVPQNLYSDDTLRSAFDELRGPIEEFIMANKISIEHEGDTEKPFIRVMKYAQAGAKTGVEPVRTLVQLALSRYFARIKAGSVLHQEDEAAVRDRLAVFDAAFIDSPDK
jgi:hypothetical protein